MVDGTVSSASWDLSRSLFAAESYSGSEQDLQIYVRDSSSNAKTYCYNVFDLYSSITT